MSKKNREFSKLRREVEFLKTQLKYQEGLSETNHQKLDNGSSKAVIGHQSRVPNGLQKQPIFLETNYPYLKKDLAKALLLSVFSFTIIFLIYFFQDRIGYRSQ